MMLNRKYHSNSHPFRTYSGYTNRTINFGKHRGETIDEIVKSDPSYIVWLSENANIEQLKTDCLDLVDLAKESIKKVNADGLTNFAVLKSGTHRIKFTTGPSARVGDPTYGIHGVSEMPENIQKIFKILENKYYCKSFLKEDGSHVVYIIFDNVEHVGGRFPYNKAIIDGKPMSIKGKEVNVTLVVFYSTMRGGKCVQFASAKNKTK